MNDENILSLKLNFELNAKFSISDIIGDVCPDWDDWLITKFGMKFGYKRDIDKIEIYQALEKLDPISQGTAIDFLIETGWGKYKRSFEFIFDIVDQKEEIYIDIKDTIQNTVFPIAKIDEFGTIIFNKLEKNEIDRMPHDIKNKFIPVNKNYFTLKTKLRRF